MLTLSNMVCNMSISYILPLNLPLSFLIDPHYLLIMPHPIFLHISIHSMVNLILVLSVIIALSVSHDYNYNWDVEEDHPGALHAWPPYALPL